MADLTDTSNEGNLSPSLTFENGQGQRYPNQFFDLSQQYMPPTIKELFRWCTFYYYNSPLIGSALKKVSRYPITDLIFEDQHESNRDAWKTILVDELKMKDKLMEVNLDYHVYGNAFVSLHMPFIRFLICPECKTRQPIRNWEWQFQVSSYTFHGACPSDGCNYHGRLNVKDVPYKDRRAVKLLRWSPENIHLKFNDFTGRYVYMYSIPSKLKNAIYRGDKDVLEDIPLVVLEALQKRRMIRLNPDNIKHLKAPTLAEQDQGWGKPTIIHVLKDMYYFYTLRRAQEAIALEHIIPFDMIYPMPNAQQDPYIHTDLGSWRTQIQNIIKRHRRDPNFKAVIPIPVGFARVGGDGKALLLSPEMNYLTQTIVGGMGIPQEFLFGGLNYTGSSISLRTLENDFIQNRSQLLDLVYWVKDKIRIWLSLPDIKKMKFADFRMADDVQRNQQLIGLNAQQKVSDKTLLTELGYDFDQEVKKIIEETFIKNYLLDLQSKGGAKSQGEAQLIQFNYQQKIQEIAEKAQKDAMKKMREEQNQGMIADNAGLGTSIPGEEGMDAAAMQAQQQGMLPPGDQQQMAASEGWAGAGGEAPAVGTAGHPAQGAPLGGSVDADIENKVQSWAQKLMGMDQAQARITIAEIKAKMPGIGKAVEDKFNQMQAEQLTAEQAQEQAAQQPGAPANGVNMAPMPDQRPPRRAGGI